MTTLAHTWRIYNTSTMLPVVEADPDSTLSKDEARKAAADFLLAEANAADDEDTAAMLDDAAQQLNYADGVSIGGTFDWEVTLQTTGTLV